MADQPADIEMQQDHLQEGVTAEDILDDVLGGGDFIDDLHSLKGIISAALGRLGFKFSFVVVLLFNFLCHIAIYTMHLPKGLEMKYLPYHLATVAVIPVIECSTV